jgi:hypothetical protein
MKDRAGHPHDRAATFFGEVASRTDSAAEWTVLSGVRQRRG